jgi:hypothetical protein
MTDRDGQQDGVHDERRGSDAARVLRRAGLVRIGPEVSAPGALRAARTAAGLIRRTAAARLERRLRAGVVVFAVVREEQDLLERFASLLERDEPLTARQFAGVERFAAEKTPPPLIPSLLELHQLVGPGPEATPVGSRPPDRSAPVGPE